MSKVYIKLLIILTLFLSSIVLGEEKSVKSISLPDSFEAITAPITLSVNSILYNQKMEKTSLENFDNRFIIVHFWASWCMDCNIELIAINNLQKEFRKKSLVVVAISEDFKGVDAIDQYFTKYKIDYLDIYLDKKNKIYQDLMINHLPATYLIDMNGKVIARSKPNKLIDWNNQSIKDFLEEKVSKYQLLPPEFKKIRDKYEAPKQKNKKATKTIKKNKLFIN